MADFPTREDLSPLRDRIFVERYLATMDRRQAAQDAGYNCKSPYHYYSMGSHLLVRPRIKRMIKERLSALIMEANETIFALSEQARASIGEFIKNGDDGPEVDFDAVKRRGHLIRSVKVTDEGIELTLVDSQSALAKMMRFHKLMGEVT